MNKERLATNARYLTGSREVEITLDDGSRHAWPVDRLEMLKWTGEKLDPILNPPDELLVDVQVWGGGSSIYWQQLEQVFSIDDLIDGVYGREAWMQSLSVIA